ncbi:MAG: hypothetical protein SGBAC_006621, partial [Bacillariaceae sp.]
DNLGSKKDVPVVILCNKIDDQDDEEQQELVSESQHEIEKIFGVPDRQKSLQQVLQAGVCSTTTTFSEKVSPVFIPISGITAFVFQTCSNMSLERFRQFDENLIAKLGRDRIGKFRWKKLSDDEKIKEAHEAVSDPEGYQEGVADSNFDKFLKVLSILVGGKDVQEKMIKEQIRVSLTTISSGPGIVNKLESVYKTVVNLSLEDSEEKLFLADIKSTFWRLCKGMEPSFFPKKESPAALESFVCLARELKQYGAFASTAGWNPELSVVFFKNAAPRFLDRTRGTPGFVKDLKAAYCAMKEMSLEAEDSPTVAALKHTFDRCFQRLTAEKFTKFKSTDTVRQLALLADELVGYSKLATEAGWISVHLTIGARFKEVVLRQIGALCDLASNGPAQQCFGYESSKSSKSTPFADYSWLDWKLALRSILLLRYDRQFCLDFGREMVLMECLLGSEPTPNVATKTNELCPSCKSALTFNRVCTQCGVPAHASKGFQIIKCFRKNCNGKTNYETRSNVAMHRCTQCSQCQYIQVLVNIEREVKHMCPSCVGQELDYNRRCGKCDVLFFPQSEYGAKSVCPWDGQSLDQSTGKCRSCANVWKEVPDFPHTGSVKLRYDGNGISFSDTQGKHAIDIPSSLSDPNHFGHLAWQYCEFMATGVEKRSG